MLLIAMPKSASTSIMITIGKLHDINAKQEMNFSTQPYPDECKILFKYHSDIRELSPETVELFKQNNSLYKQHIFPSINNIDLLKNEKKIILLRKPKDILLAYRRGSHKKVHTLLDGFSLQFNEKEWINKSTECGLLNDLEYFHNKWVKESQNKNTMTIEYVDLIENTKETINKIEDFFSLPITKSKITLERSRYTRRNPIHNFIYNSTQKIKKNIALNLKK